LAAAAKMQMIFFVICYSFTLQRADAPEWIKIAADLPA